MASGFRTHWFAFSRKDALAFAKNYLLTHDAPANKAGDPKGTFSTTVSSSGLTKVYTGAAADTLVRAAKGDPHAPDLIGIAQHGVVYTGNVKKIAEAAKPLYDALDESQKHKFGMLGRMLMPERSRFAMDMMHHHMGEHDRDGAE